MITKNDIINAYCVIRKTNNTIPDEVLDFMKYASLKEQDKLNEIQVMKDKLIEFGWYETIEGNWYNPYFGVYNNIKDAYNSHFKS